MVKVQADRVLEGTTAAVMMFGCHRSRPPKQLATASDVNGGRARNEANPTKPSWWHPAGWEITNTMPNQPT